MKEAVSGVYGFRDYHLIFSNSLIGKLLVLLYSISNSFAWYEIIHLLFALLSFTQITYIFLLREKECLVIFIIIVISILEYCVLFQFTKTASVLAIAGSLSIIESFRDNSKLYIPGLFFLFLSFCIRQKQSIACILICIFFYFPYIKKYLKKALIFLMVLFVGFIGIYTYNQLTYKNDAWRKYSQFNVIRADLRDKGIPSFNINKERYDDIGITENAYNMLLIENYDDSNIFTIDKLEEIKSIKKDNISLKKYLSALIKYSKYNMNYLLLFISSLIYICLNDKSTFKNGLLCGYIIVFIFALYCLISQCEIKPRVINFLIIESLIFTNYSYQININNKYTKIGLILLFLLFIPFNYLKGIGYKTQANKPKLTKLNENNKYIVDFQTYNEICDYSLFKTYANNELSNVIVLGGCPTFSPTFINRNDRNGIENQYVSMIEDDLTYFICNETNINDVEKYLSDYYYQNISHEYIDLVWNDVVIYKIIKY